MNVDELISAIALGITKTACYYVRLNTLDADEFRKVFGQDRLLKGAIESQMAFMGRRILTTGKSEGIVEFLDSELKVLEKTE